ncbi:MAG: glycosyltransferase [Clostridia bacterium]|nr:glycosyltransferase [Clostridia bacterium]
MTHLHEMQELKPVDLRLGARRAVAIVPAQNEERTIDAVLRQLRRLPLDEVVVVVNGSQDRTAEIAAGQGCRVIEITGSLGHDVGRAVGAAVTDADIYLFTDADIVVPSEDLAPFLRAVANGVDVALNDLNRIIALPHRVHVVALAKAFLNHCLDRPDLGVNSLTGIPHALSRRAVETIGWQRLAVPPLAHAAAVLAGLRVRSVHAVDVATRNRVHRYDSPTRSPLMLERLILGDHLEALDLLRSVHGARGGRNDAVRRRDQMEAIVERVREILAREPALAGNPGRRAGAEVEAAGGARADAPAKTDPAAGAPGAWLRSPQAGRRLPWWVR